MKCRELASIIIFAAFVGGLSVYVADRSEVGPHGELVPKKERITVVEKVVTVEKPVVVERVVEKDCKSWWRLW